MRIIVSTIVIILFLPFHTFTKDEKDFYIIYSHPSLIEVSNFFSNDLSIVLRDTNIKSFLSYEKIEEIMKAYNKGIFISLYPKNSAQILYFSSGEIKKTLTEKISRDLSIKAIKLFFNLSVPLVKKKILVFDFLDKSEKNEKIEEFSKVFSFNVSENLLKSNNFMVNLANREFKNDIVQGYDVYIYGFYSKAGENITVYSYVYDNFTKTLKFSFKDSFKFDKKDYIYFLDKISSKISNAVIREYRPSPPQVIFKEKYIEIEKKEEEKKEKEKELKEIEEKKIKEGLYNFERFNIEGINPVFTIPKHYADKGIIEIGLSSNSYFNGFNSGNFNQYLNLTNFTNIFFIDRWYLGYRLDLDYNIDNKIYNIKTFLSAGGAIKISKTIFISLGILIGYSKNTSNYYYYGNEVLFKIVLTESSLFSFGLDYTFVTDLSKIYFNDVLRPFLGFSVYF